MPRNLASDLLRSHILGRMDYTPFGSELTSGAALRAQRFAGLFRDGEAGLDYAQGADVPGPHGRFTAPDPVETALFEPQRWNR